MYNKMQNFSRLVFLKARVNTWMISLFFAPHILDWNFFLIDIDIIYEAYFGTLNNLSLDLNTPFLYSDDLVLL